MAGSHLGSGLAEKLRAYCVATDDDATAAMCTELISAKESSSISELDVPSEDQPGFVYLLKSGRFYKFGRTNAVGRRERELAIQLPEKAALVHEITTDDAPGIEEYWHKRFAACRKNGEWFELSAREITAFKRRKFM
jgi:hypothetical protein